MKTKRLLSALLTVLMVISSLSMLSACNRNGGEPIKSKRTNVYGGVDIEMPDGIDWISNIVTANDSIYLQYTRSYTVFYNDLGEEVERREGYYYEEWTGQYDDIIIDEIPVMPYNENGVNIPQDTDAETKEADADEPTDETDDGPDYIQQGSDEYSFILPKGWSYIYESIPAFTKVPLDGGEMVEREFNIGNLSLSNFFIDDNGNITTLSENWDSANIVYTFITFSFETGDIISRIDLNDKLTARGYNMENFYVYNFAKGQDGNIYMSHDAGVIGLDGDLNIIMDEKIDGWVNNMFDIGGRMLVIYSTNTGAMQTKTIENGKLQNYTNENFKSVLDNIWNTCGASDNKLYYRVNQKVMSFDFGSGATEEVIDFINCDIDYYDLNNVSVLKDGRIIICSNKWTEDGNEFTAQVLTRIPDEEMAEEIIITIGSTYSDYNLTKSIIRFNRQNTGVRVALKTYESYNNEDNDYRGAIDQFNNDISMGNIPDIVLLNSEMPIESYFRQNLFTDLNKYFDDPENGIDRSKYLSNIFDACSIDGELYSVMLSFSLHTLEAKSKYVGTDPGWTFDEMMQCIKSAPEGMEPFFGYTRDEIIGNFFNYALNSFVDWDTGKTSFESQAFIDFIKFLSTCKVVGYWDELYGEDYVYDPNLEMEYMMNYDLRYYRDNAMFNFAYMSDFTQLLNNMNQFATKEITCIGYPTNDPESNGAVIVPGVELAISNKSQAKDQAWQFIKFIMDDEEFYENIYTFSTSRPYMETMMKNAENSYWSGGYSEEDREWMKQSGYSDEYINYLINSQMSFSPDVVEQVMDIVEGATQVQRVDSEVIKIINEELSGFFGGTRSAEETARVIAGRVSIYIAENS